MAIPVREWIERTRAALERAEREQFARVRAQTQAERVVALEAASIAAKDLLAAMTPEARARALAWREPLPESTVRALRRLREKANNRESH